MYTALRPSARLLASHAHAPRTPMISFPDRSHTPPHSLGPHPCAPQSIIDSSPFLSNLSNSSSTTTNTKPLLGPAGGQARGSGFQSSLPPAQYDDYSLPAWLQRSRYAPNEDEVEAVLSGGASISPVISKQYKEKWYTAQI